jgi:small-conductance mechanosensitive channel
MQAGVKGPQVRLVEFADSALREAGIEIPFPQRDIDFRASPPDRN